MTTQSAEDYFGGDFLAASVWRNKYALRDADGNVVEVTPADTHRRLAKEFARIEANYPNAMSEEEIYGLLADWTVVPQGSPMSAIGNTSQIQSTANCFVVEKPYDAYAGILLADQELAQIMKRRGGVGIDISSIRPRGMKTSNAAGSTDGIGVFMERFSSTCREVAQGGRRGALMISVSCMHPDIETFINIKQDKTKVTGANVSVRMTDEFMCAVESDSEIILRWPVDVSIQQAKFTKTVKAKVIWDQLIAANWSSAEPGILFWDTVTKTGMSDLFADKGFETISTNPCVSGDTLILTDIGHLPIQSLVGRSVNVWNGVEWSEVVPYATQYADTLIVTLSNGCSIRCTDNHEFVIQKNYWTSVPTKIRAEHLAVGDKLAKVSMPSSVEGETYPIDAYSQGFYAGDGNDGLNFSFIYPPKYVCASSLVGAQTADISSGRIRWSHGPMLPKTFVPINGNREYCLKWLAGILDSDGTVTTDKIGSGYQISSIDPSFLNDMRLMLCRFGVQAKISNHSKQQVKLMPDGRGGIKEYPCQDCFRILISSHDSWHLSELGLRTYRLQHNKQKPSRQASRFIQVVSVTKAPACQTFCFTEPKLGQGTFNGVVTAQCGEIPLGKYDSCRLLLLNLSKFVSNPFTNKASFDYDRFHVVTKKAQYLMDDMIDLEIEAVDRIISKVKSDPEPDYVKAVELNLWTKVREAAVKGRRTGLGITALGDTLAMLGIKYGSDQSVQATDDIYKALEIAAHTASIQMAEERGVFPACDPSVYKKAYLDGHLMVCRLVAATSSEIADNFLSVGRRNIALTTTAPAGSMSILTQSSSGCEPVFMLSYTRRKKVNPNDPSAQVDFVDGMGDQWSEYVVHHHGLKKWMEITGETDITKSPYYGATANEIDWNKSVELQAAAQKWVEHAISKTCNLPNSVTKEQVSDLYFKAWKSGCKGFTIYRDGSRSGVLVATEPKKEAGIVTTKAPKRPEVLKCDIHRTTISGESYVMLVGLLNGQPYEVFCGLSKNIGLPKSKITGTITKRPVKGGMAAYDLAIPSGQDEIVISDVVELFDNPLYGAFTRTLSLSLRHGVPVQFVVEQLRKDKYSDMQSFAAAVARVLCKHYILDGTKATSEKTCSECKSPDLAYQSGCVTCMQCGNSKCG